MALSRATLQIKFEDNGELTERFSLWKQRMEIYSQITNKKNEHLVPYILQSLDDEGLKIYKASSSSSPSSNTARHSTEHLTRAQRVRISSTTTWHATEHLTRAQRARISSTTTWEYTEHLTRAQRAQNNNSSRSN